MGGTEFVILCVAAVIMAVNQGLRDATAITERFAFLRPRGWWNYVPLGLVVIASIVWVWPPSSKVPGQVAISGVPVEAIDAAFEGRTDAEARRIIVAYAGATATVTGAVRDVRFNRFGPDDMRLASVAFETDYPERSVYLSFEDKDADTVASLRKGEKITARCKFDAEATDSISNNFELCRLTDGPHPPS